jgi:hypothetical protein
MSGARSPRLRDLVPFPQILIRIDSLFQLNEASGHVLEAAGVSVRRWWQNWRLTRSGRVSAKENDREPHGARDETSTKCPEDYLQHHASTEDDIPSLIYRF